MSTTKQDSAGNVLATTTYSYDPGSLGATVVTDPNGHSTTTVRDSQANLLSVTDALGRNTASTYNAFNEPLVVTDASGVQTTNSYDGNGNLTQTSRPLVGSSPAQSQTVAYTYGDPLHPGDLTRMTDANGKLWNYTYDANGYRNAISDPLANQTTYTYDSVGRLTAKVTPKGNVAGCGCAATYTTSYTVNAWGQPLTATDPLLHKTTYTYDGDQRLTSVLDGNNHATTYKYDLDGEQTEVDRQDGTKLFTGYDANGNVQSQTDGLNHATTYGYDALNRKTSMTDALNRATTYAYDSAGNLTSLLDARGQTTTYAYDAGDQLVAIRYSDNRTPNVSYSYDALGERLSMVDGSGTTTYSYDSLKRLTQSTNGAGPQLKYGYDLKGQLTSIVYPGTTGTVTRTYDDAGRLATVRDWLSHTTTIKYDPNSNLNEQDYPNGVVTTLGYNAADQLTSITDALGTTQLLNFSYTRDGIGQLSTDGTKGYAYDTINRLQTYTESPTSSLTYGYDNADRLTSRAIQGGNTRTYAYDAGDQLQTVTITSGTTQVGSRTYTFDGNGNRAQVVDQSNTKTAYAYDQANRLTGYNASATYSYNGDGLRMSKTVNGVAAAFTWDVAEGLPLLLQDGSTSYVTGPGGLPLEQVTGSTVLYFHADQMGSTRALSDATGTVPQSYVYDPYGILISSSGTISNPFQYAGQYLDTESTLYYLRARYYEPWSGQFITVDPIRSRTRQPYGYAVDSPVNGADPTGLVSVANDAGATPDNTQSLQAWNDALSAVLNACVAAARSTSANASRLARGLRAGSSFAGRWLRPVSRVAGALDDVPGVGALGIAISVALGLASGESPGEVAASTAGSVVGGLIGAAVGGLACVGGAVTGPADLAVCPLALSAGIVGGGYLGGLAGDWAFRSATTGRSAPWSWI